MSGLYLTKKLFFIFVKLDLLFSFMKTFVIQIGLCNFRISDIGLSCFFVIQFGCTWFFLWLIGIGFHFGIDSQIEQIESLLCINQLDVCIILDDVNDSCQKLSISWRSL